MIDYAIRKQIRHLTGYISDKTAVMQHVNREHNLKLTLADIEEASRPFPSMRTLDPHRAPMTPSPLIVTHHHKGHDPLAKALFEYHAKRSTGPERAYWLDRLNDRKPKPSTTIEL